MTALASTANLMTQDNSGSNWSREWQKHALALSLAWLGVAFLFWRDFADMAAIWWNASTFNHCLLILPIIAWLVLQRKEELVHLTPVGWLPGILPMAGASLLWLFGDAAGLGLFRQVGVIGMLQSTVLIFLGPNVSRGLMFPLFYMVFLVPFGEELVPILQTVTAEMCMLFLDLWGIPATIDGIFITTPGGYFKVAEACAGVKFLIAMVALGALVSNLSFKNADRRVAFMFVSIIVPILANGVRAFSTIVIAQNGNIEFAASFDHVIYGWVFFAVVIALVMGIGWRFFDKKADAQAFKPAKLQAIPKLAAPLFLVAALAVLAVLPVVGWAKYVGNAVSPVPHQISLPEIDNWQIVPYEPSTDWQPRFEGNSHRLLGRYRHSGGDEIDLYIAVYEKQSEGRELVGYGQGAVDPESKWSWVADVPGPLSGKAERIKAPGPVVREVASFYRVNGVTSGSAAAIKLATLKARLLGGNQQAVAILVSGEFKGEDLPRPAIDRFIEDMGNIDKIADQMAGLR